MKHFMQSSLAVATAIFSLIPSMCAVLPTMPAYASEITTEETSSALQEQQADLNEQQEVTEGTPTTEGEQMQTVWDETVYPDVSLFSDTLSFSVLHDFDVFDDYFALAGTVQNPTSEAEKNNGFYLYQNGSYTFHASPSQAEIVAVDYDQDGTLYFSDGQKTYRYPDNQLVSYSFASATAQVTYSPYYYFITNGSLYILNLNEPTLGAQSCGSGYVKLVAQNGIVYALKDTSIVKFNGTTQTEQTFDYVNYERATGISVGKTFELLQQLQEIKFVNIAEGAYVTPVDLTASATSVDGTFVVDKTYQTTREVRMALLLCTTGNAWLYATKDGCFLTLVPQNAVFNTASVVAKNEQDYVNAQCAVYSSPYISPNTSLGNMTLGTQITVTGLVECQTYTNLTCDWYVVSCQTESGQTVQGYIPAGFVYGYSFTGEKNTYQTLNPAYSESNMIRTVFLIMVVVTLVLIIFGYLVGVATRRPREKKRRTKQEVSQPAKK